MTPAETIHLETDVLVVGAGGAGMYAAIAAERGGAQVLLLDKNVISRGGATIMAQMTVAAALGEEEPDDWTLHLADTLEAGRGLCQEDLATAVCHDGPARIREMDEWHVGWARADGRIRQVVAPGHGRKRCVYVDYLNTGPAVASKLHVQVNRRAGVRRLSNVVVTEIVVNDGRACGAVGFDLATARPVTIAAKAVIVAAGGLTTLYRRNSASANMAGESYSLALRAGAALVDMEFVQFFPIGHLAPRLVGMDPIMWDPFRYKLGGRLLNGAMEEFIENYGGQDSGVYRATRDVATYAIFSEVRAGRGSPHGGAYLSFQHIPEDEIRAAVGPMVDRLAKNGIDLTKMPVEVAPIAHYHMGGIFVSDDMQSSVPGLYAAGEAVGGSNGANRLSGNAITEALVFGERAGRFAARAAAKTASAWNAKAAAGAVDEVRARRGHNGNGGPSAAALTEELKDLMWTQVGPFRTAEGLEAALARIHAMRAHDLEAVSIPAEPAFNMALADWFALRGGLLAAETVTRAAIERRESRGAHQREDFPGMIPEQAMSRLATLQSDEIALRAKNGSAAATREARP